VDTERACHNELLSRKIRGLRWKQRKFTRTLDGRAPSGSDQKVSCFNYSALREENDLLQTANVQQICTATAPAKARSPLAKVKRERHSMQASLESSAKKQRLLAGKCQWDQAKISSLKAHNNQLMQDIFLRAPRF